MDWLEQYIEIKDDFPRPDWERIYKHIEEHFKDANQKDLWCDISNEWVKRVQQTLGSEYHNNETDNFLVISSRGEKYSTLLLEFMERSRNNILKHLNGIASDEGFGKHIILNFKDIDTYYSYVLYFYPESGEFGLSSGMFLDGGYGHFVLAEEDQSLAETITSHELTHALLSHIPIPLWLNEGMAVNMENILTNSAPLRMESEMYERHKKFWNDETIQEFWSGKSFSRPDEGMELSYHLAQFAVFSLSEDYKVFKNFTNNAHFDDAGEKSAQENYGGSLGALISQYFGEGEWMPRPEIWGQENSNK